MEETTELEIGYYQINNSKKILYWDGNKWLKPIKDQQKSYGTWLGHLDKQPKIKALAFIGEAYKHIL